MWASREILLADGTGPLMVLESYRVDDTDIGWEPARQELLRHQAERAEPGCPWGYFPGLEPDELTLYPRSRALADQLSSRLIPQMVEDASSNLLLAFVRAARGRVTAAFGGLHFDTEIEVTHPRGSRYQGADILRVLVNLHTQPRTLAYLGQTRRDLVRAGIEVSDSSYARLPLSAEIPKSTVHIPSRRLGTVFLLKFFSNLVAHVGITDEHGHFLASYGAYVSRP